MRVLMIHNHYQKKGGEDGVFEAEYNLLRHYGHDVSLYTKHNDSINHSSKIGTFLNLYWSASSNADIKNLIDQFQPDVIHAHNTFPLISPSVYWLASNYKIPVVQTLHNFRLSCLNGFYLRAGEVCEKCIGKVPISGIFNRCYRNSYVESTALASMLVLHRSIGSYKNKVAKYIALNDFCADKFVQSGIDRSKIVVKPNFKFIPYPKKIDRKGFLFVGRLSEEKGINVIVEMAKKNPDFEISVAGEGPEKYRLADINNINILGKLNQGQLIDQMQKACALLMPSLWYENLPLTLIEAFGSGLPIIASKIGALESLIRNEVTGLHFKVGDSDDMANKMNWLLQNKSHIKEMSINARLEYETKYTPEANYNQLTKIYETVIHAKK